MTWDRRDAASWAGEQDRLLVEWLETEVRPYSAWWRERLADVEISGTADLRKVDARDAATLGAAGGPGNPALLLAPSEDDVKRHATRAQLAGIVREVRGGAAEERRIALYRRYKPVHVHRAGVDGALTIAYTRTDLDRLHLAGARLAEVLGLRAEDRLVSAVPPGPTLPFWGLYHAALGARMTALHPRTEGGDLVRDVVEACRVLPPTVLAAPTAELRSLLLALGRAGARLPQLRTMLAVGRPPSPRRRALLADLVEEVGADPSAVRVQAVWAPSAARTLWGECRPPLADPAEAGYGLHVSPDLEHLGVRDPVTGEDVDEDAPGELVLTSIGWHGTALVRHATGDWTAGVVTETVCPSCGRSLPRVSPRVLPAAYQPVVRDRNEVVRPVDLRPGAAVLREASLAQAGVLDWSLRGEDGQIVLALDGPRRGDDAVRALARRVRRAVGAPIEVRLERVGEEVPRLGAAPRR